MAKELHHWTLSGLAAILGGEASGEDVVVSRPVPAGSDDSGGITFATNEKYLMEVLGSKVGAVIVPRQCPEIPKPCIRVDDPRVAFGMVLGMSVRPLPLGAGVHPTAVVSPEATVHESAQVGAYAVVEAGAVLEAGVKVYPYCYVGDSCKIGSGSVIYPNVVLYQDVVLGEKCIVHSGAVLGADGFGFVWDGTRRIKVPQVGGVTVGDFVEIGANSCIDRATSGETTIGSGVKIDNLVQIAHNVKIGNNSVMASHVGIAGSSTIGERVVFGGQAGMADHTNVGDDVVFGGRVGVIGDITEPGEYFGMPPVPVKTAMRVMALQNRLPDMLKRIRDLEKKVEELGG